MPVLEFRPKDRRDRQSVWLSRHARNVTSQHGQDGIISKIFELIGTTNKACCEFGAWDGRLYSNTYTLITEEGWSGYLIEADEMRFRNLLQTYNDNPRAHTLNVAIGFEPETTLDAVLHAAGAPRELDLLVIDIDGNDWHVWNSLEQFRPRVVAIEYHPRIGNDVYFVQDRDPAVHQGNSPLALVELAKSKGYELISMHGDAFFVLKELFPLFEIKDNSLDAMHFVRTETKCFGGYDGKMWHVGFLRMGWQANRAFSPDELQVLSSFSYEP